MLKIITVHSQECAKAHFSLKVGREGDSRPLGRSILLVTTSLFNELVVTTSSLNNNMVPSYICYAQTGRILSIQLIILLKVSQAKMLQLEL